MNLCMLVVGGCIGIIIGVTVAAVEYKKKVEKMLREVNIANKR